MAQPATAFVDHVNTSLVQKAAASQIPALCLISLIQDNLHVSGPAFLMMI